ncbi:MAG: glycosyltransferase family 2 protein [Kiritimatiellae bacterium]|nr:glycosyltransferase family 2 protein [Kiritimatiellia bacterium]
MKRIAIAIPACEPAPALVGVVRGLIPRFRDIVIVDDGSRSAGDVFEAVSGMEGVRILVHPQNRGKGAALKTAFAEILRTVPGLHGVVTADADGQHVPSDILRVAKALENETGNLVLGARAFSGEIPFRSRLGNFWTRAEFRLLTGVKVDDTQSGLRGIPKKLLPRIMGLKGDRYEYETRMLVDCARRLGRPVHVPVSTVYEKGNPTSRYRPLADTLRTQSALFAAAFF